MLRTVLLVLLSVVLVSCADDIEKLSSNVIRNGSLTYTYEIGGNLYVVRSPGNQLSRITYFDFPSWSIPYQLLGTPDVNILGETILIYFTAITAYRNVSTIGVAICDVLEPNFAEHYFNTFAILDPPLFYKLSFDYMDIKSPTLMQSSGEHPILFFSNSTTTFGVFLRGGYLYNGIAVIIPPSLGWEEGVVNTPRALVKDDMHYVLYMTGDGETVGAVRSANIAGPYEKKLQPVGRVKDRNTNIHELHVNEITWGEDGWPIIH